jgi:hypothetical protein
MLREVRLVASRGNRVQTNAEGTRVSEPFAVALFASGARFPGCLEEAWSASTNIDATNIEGPHPQTPRTRKFLQIPNKHGCTHCECTFTFKQDYRLLEFSYFLGKNRDPFAYFFARQITKIVRWAGDNCRSDSVLEKFVIVVRI